MISSSNLQLSQPISSEIIIIQRKGHLNKVYLTNEIRFQRKTRMIKPEYY